MKLPPAAYAKAIVSAVLAGLIAAGQAMSDGSITGPEWIGVAFAVVASGGAVFGVPNRPYPVKTKGGSK